MSDHYLLVDADGKATEVVVEVKIGRAKTNDVVLSDPLASRHHATVYIEGNSILIRDEGSVNGTLVNGKRIYDPSEIKDQDRLQFGDEVLVVRAPIAQSKTIKSMESQPQNDPEAGTLLKTAQQATGHVVSGEPIKDSKDSVNIPESGDRIPNGVIRSGKKDQRRNILIAVLAFMLLCVCCASILVIYFYVLRDSSSIFGLWILGNFGLLCFT